MLGRNSPRRILCFFFFNDTATTEIYTLSLHDALPISVGAHTVRRGERVRPAREAADDATTGVEDVERDALILVLEPVIDHRAVGWVLPYGMRLVRREREATRPVDPVGVARLEEMRGFARCGPHQLAQGRD